MSQDDCGGVAVGVGWATLRAMTNRTTGPRASGGESEAADPLLARALTAVGRTRALGLHFYGHFIGIGGKQAVDGRSEATIEGEPNGTAETGASPVALATVADLAIGAAIRSHLKMGCRLGTVTLTLQHAVGAVDGPIVARGEAQPCEGEMKPGRCVLLSADGRLVGTAQGWFAALPPPPGVALPAPGSATRCRRSRSRRRAELDEQEHAAVSAARAAGQRARRRRTTISEEAAPLRLAPLDGGGLHLGRACHRAGLANRVGHIQGGALYGGAALVATKALGVPSSALIEGHYQFIRPADGAILHGEATVLRRGRLGAFVESRLAVDGKLVGAGLFSFRL